MKQMQVSNSLRKFVKQNMPENLFHSLENAEGKTNYIRSVVQRGMERATLGMNQELLEIALQLQFLSYAYMSGSDSNFMDVRKCDRRYVAIQCISSFIRQEGCNVTPDWLVIIDVIRNLGIKKNNIFANAFSLPYMQIAYTTDEEKLLEMTMSNEEEELMMANA